MAYITNDGARLIERARTEGKFIVFGAVRMNTIFKSDPSSLVQKSDEWFGANHGQVVGCLSHVSVDDVSCVCDSKLAVQCNDNSEPWKSIGIYAHLEGEVDELLFACESIQNGEYKDVTIVELPVTLDGVVADFGLSEGGGGGGGGGEEGSTAPLTGDWQRYVGEGSVEDPVDGGIRTLENLSVGGGEASVVLERRESQYIGEEGIWGEDATTFLRITPGGVSLNESGANWSDIINAANSGGGGGGGGDVPANMMTTDTNQEGLTGMKQWSWEIYEREGAAEEPQEGDIKTQMRFSINSLYGGGRVPVVFESLQYQYSSGDGVWYPGESIDHVDISFNGVYSNSHGRASWANIISAANRNFAETRAGLDMVVDEGENLVLFGNTIVSGGFTHDGIQFIFDSSGYLEGVSNAGEYGIATISVMVQDSNGVMVENGRISGVSVNVETPLTFQSPIQLQVGYTITYQATFSST